MIEVEIRGLEVFGHHGVTEEERSHGQTFLFDVRLEVADDAARTDDLEDTVDYVEVADRIRHVSDAKQFELLEALAAAVAEDILHNFSAANVRVRVRKPGVRPAGLSAEWAAATVERTR